MNKVMAARCSLPNNIIECFFCDNDEDMKIYNMVGIDAIVKTIAEGDKWYYYEKCTLIKNGWVKCK